MERVLVFANGQEIANYVAKGDEKRKFVVPPSCFSEDGTAFTYTVTVEKDEYNTLWRDGEPAERVLLAESGIYTVVIDVPTGIQTITRDPLEPREGGDPPAG